MFISFLQLDCAEKVWIRLMKCSTILDLQEFLILIKLATKCINIATKNESLQCLIFGEVQKRQAAIQAFCKGLEFLHIHSLLKDNPELLKQAFLDMHS